MDDYLRRLARVHEEVRLDVVHVVTTAIGQFSYARMS